MTNRQGMALALRQAEQAAAAGEIPVGAVVVKNGTVIGEGRNRREETGNALAHAEIEAIAAACQTLGDWRLDGCTLFVTLEPCGMCTGAIVGARLSQVVFGAYDRAAGCFDSNLRVADFPESRLSWFGGICEEDCRALLTSFFEKVREP